MKRNWSSLSTPPDLEKGYVHVWRVYVDTSREPLESFRSNLSTDELDRAGRFRFDEDRHRFITAHGSLRELLGHYLHTEPRIVDFEKNEYGKPRLIGHELEFNISHSGNFLLIAFCLEHRIGVDVEHFRKNIEVEQVAQRFFSKREIASLMDLPSDKQMKAFFHVWTRKEAYIKAHGLGLSLPLDSFDVSLDPGASNALIATRPDKIEADRWTIASLDMGDEYAGAVAVDGRELNIELFELQMDRNSTFQ